MKAQRVAELPARILDGFRQKRAGKIFLPKQVANAVCPLPAAGRAKTKPARASFADFSFIIQNHILDLTPNLRPIRNRQDVGFLFKYRNPFFRVLKFDKFEYSQKPISALT
jgi:hypothetical protein